MNNIFKKKFIIIPIILGTMVMTSTGVYANSNFDWNQRKPAVLNETEGLGQFNKRFKNNLSNEGNSQDSLAVKKTIKPIFPNLIPSNYEKRFKGIRSQIEEKVKSKVEKPNEDDKIKQSDQKQEQEKYIKYQKWLKQKEASKKVNTSADSYTITNGRQIYMPPKAGAFKAWMGYQAVTNTNTLNYAICHNSITDPSTGIRVKNGRYLVALGPKVVPGVGYEVDIYLSNGQVIHALTGDSKGHTYDGVFQQGKGITSCVEFIVDQSNSSPIYTNGIARMGGVGHLPQFSGYVTKFVVGNKVI